MRAYKENIHKRILRYKVKKYLLENVLVNVGEIAQNSLIIPLHICKFPYDLIADNLIDLIIKYKHIGECKSWGFRNDSFWKMMAKEHFDKEKKFIMDKINSAGLNWQGYVRRVKNDFK